MGRKSQVGTGDWWIWDLEGDKRGLQRLSVLESDQSLLRLNRSGIEVL